MGLDFCYTAGLVVFLAGALSQLFLKLSTHFIDYLLRLLYNNSNLNFQNPQQLLNLRMPLRPILPNIATRINNLRHRRRPLARAQALTRRISYQLAYLLGLFLQGVDFVVKVG